MKKKSTQLTRRIRQSITLYDPDKGLETIAIAEIGEKHWARAKDAGRLLAAIETKIIAQAEYVVYRDGVVASPTERGRRGGRGIKPISELKSALPNADPGDVTAHRWRKRFCVKNGKGTEIDEEKLADALNDARLRCVRICEQQNMGTVRGTEGTGEFERYTPAQYIAAAREVLGEIDLDPASNAKAQRTVKALRYFTAKDNGLAQEWHGRIWLNPPYHRELGPAFVDKMVAEIEAGRIAAAIMLTNNCTDTDWFDVALRVSASVCFTRGRIRFLQPNGNEVLPTQGQAFFYFGSAPIRFEEVFCRIGPCMRITAHYSASENHGQDHIDSTAQHYS